MTATCRPLTRSYLRDRLRELARGWEKRDLAVRQILLAGWTDPRLPAPASAPCHCGKCLLCTWNAYLHDLALLDGLRGEAWAVPYSWRDVDEEGLTGAMDPAGEAETQMEMRVAGHEDLLIGNVRTDAQEAGR